MCCNAHARPQQNGYSSDDICKLADVPKRTLRYYIQQGLLDKPIGETRSARYTAVHLERLLLIRKRVQAGASLQAIKQLLEEPDGSKPPIPEHASGDISVISKIHLAPGMSLEVDAAHQRPHRISFCAHPMDRR